MRNGHSLIAVILLFSLFLFGCEKDEKSTSDTLTGPAVDLTRNDCIGCHTSEAALKATLDDTAATAMMVGPVAGFVKYGNRVAGEG